MGAEVGIKQYIGIMPSWNVAEDFTARLQGFAGQDDRLLVGGGTEPVMTTDSGAKLGCWKGNIVPSFFINTEKRGDTQVARPRWTPRRGCLVVSLIHRLKGEAVVVGRSSVFGEIVITGGRGNCPSDWGFE